MFAKGERYVCFKSRNVDASPEQGRSSDMTVSSSQLKVVQQLMYKLCLPKEKGLNASSLEKCR